MTTSTKLLAARLAGAALLALAAAGPALADEGYDRYLGNAPLASSPATAQPAATRTAPNGYAGYQVYLGRSTDEAVALAREAGEKNDVASVLRDAQAPRDGYDAYQQVLGLSNTSAAVGRPLRWHHVKSAS